MPLDTDIRRGTSRRASPIAWVSAGVPSPPMRSSMLARASQHICHDRIPECSHIVYCIALASRPWCAVPQTGGGACVPVPVECDCYTDGVHTAQRVQAPNDRRVEAELGLWRGGAWTCGRLLGPESVGYKARIHRGFPVDGMGTGGLSTAGGGGRTERKARILCLHGFRQSASNFKVPWHDVRAGEFADGRGSWHACGLCRDSCDGRSPSPHVAAPLPAGPYGRSSQEAP